METGRDDFSIALRSAFLKRETQQKFSLLALILLSLLLLFVETFENKYLDNIRFAIKDGIYRSSVVVSYPAEGIKVFKFKLQNHFSIFDKNEKMLNELKHLRKLNFQLNYLKAENKILSELVLTKTFSDFDVVQAKVLIDKKSPFLKSFIINKGKDFNFKKGMAVLSDGILLGRIVEVNYFSSRVLLLEDLNSKIPVIIEPFGFQAILSGKGKQLPILDFLPKQQKIKNGDIVYTSGKDGILTSGIPIGKVFVENNILKVELISNISQANYVNVVLKVKENKINNSNGTNN